MKPMLPLMEGIFFFKTRYWRWYLRRWPILFIIDKCIISFLLLLVLWQMIFFSYQKQTGYDLYKSVSLAKVVGVAILANMYQLFYFPGTFAKKMQMGMYHLYPLSLNQLNAIRMMEGLFTKTFLVTVNLIVLPVYLKSQAVIFLWIAVLSTTLMLRITAMLLYDTVIFAMNMRPWLLMTSIVLIVSTLVLSSKLKIGWQSIVWEETNFSYSATTIIGLILIIMIFFLIDTGLFSNNLINKLKRR